MAHHTFVTGFLPFGGFSVNPSALLAQNCGRPFELLEVSYDAVDQWLDRVERAGAPFDRLLMLGLRGGGTTFYLEQVARNEIGVTPDVRGVVRGPGFIDPGGPPTLPGTLLADTILSASHFVSDNAGCYLCNYVYYRALRCFLAKRVGFVHVPPLEVVPLESQREQLSRLLDALEAE